MYARHGHEPIRWKSPVGIAAVSTRWTTIASGPWQGQTREGLCKSVQMRRKRICAAGSWPEGRASGKRRRSRGWVSARVSTDDGTSRVWEIGSMLREICSAWKLFPLRSRKRFNELSAAYSRRRRAQTQIHRGERRLAGGRFRLFRCSDLAESRIFHRCILRCTLLAGLIFNLTLLAESALRMASSAVIGRPGRASQMAVESLHSQAFDFSMTS